MSMDISSTGLRSERDGVSNQDCEDLDLTSVLKNGSEALVSAGVETSGSLEQYAELADMLAVGHADVEHGRTVDADEAISSLRRELSR